MRAQNITTQANLSGAVSGARTNPDSHGARGTWTLYILGAIMLSVILVASLRSLFFSAQAQPVRLVVYAFSTQEELFTQSLLPAFEKAWEAEHGRELTLEAVFGPSATLAGQIVLEAPADVAVFSNAHHLTYLRVGKKIEENAQAAVTGYTPMVIVVRPGNPLDIYDFEDLSRPGVRLLHASPRSSGGGEWAILAEYGSAFLASGDEAAATAQLHALWDNVRLMAPSARTAMTLFELGAGDALVTYEQDALLALDRGVPLEIVIPPRTIVAQPVAVIVDDNVTRLERPVAEAFLRYLVSDECQAHFIRYYQRPARDVGPPFSPLHETFSVSDLGGWSQVYHPVVNLLWKDEIEPRLEGNCGAQLLRPVPETPDEGRNPS